MFTDQDADRAEVVDGDNGPTRILLKEPEGIVKDGLEEVNNSQNEGLS